MLLRNDGLLPVDPASTARVAVLGRLASLRNLGDGGSSDVRASEVVTPLDGLRAAFGRDRVVHDDTDVSIVDGADVVVVVVGYTKDDEGEYIDNTATAALIGDLFPAMDHPMLGADAPYERPAPTGRPSAQRSEGAARPDDDGAMAPGGDRDSLRLSETDEALIAAATSRHRRVVVAVVAGSAVVMPWADTASAALVTWYSGVEGGAALADIITGRSEPGGRLPFAVPADADHLVDFDRTASTVVYDLFHGQWKLDRDGVPAHFPFGWGLGYGAPRLMRVEATSECTLRVTASNNADSPTSVVVFAFGGLDGSAHERPRRRLIGFARTVVGAGAGEVVDVDLDWSALDLRLDGAWVSEPGRYTIEVGLHADDPDSISLHLDRG